MLVKCDNCGAKYRLTIKKRPGKSVSFKCGKCGTDIRIGPEEMDKAEGSAPATVQATCAGCGNTFVKHSGEKGTLCKQCRIDSLVRNVKEKYGVDSSALEDDEESARYTIRSADGLVLGPIKLRTVKVLAREQRIKGLEEVSKDDSEFMPLMNYPELQDLFPDIKEVMDTSGLEDKLDEAFSAAFGGEDEAVEAPAAEEDETDAESVAADEEAAEREEAVEGPATAKGPAPEEVPEREGEGPKQADQPETEAGPEPVAEEEAAKPNEGPAPPEGPEEVPAEGTETGGEAAADEVSPETAETVEGVPENESAPEDIPEVEAGLSPEVPSNEVAEEEGEETGAEEAQEAESVGTVPPSEEESADSQVETAEAEEGPGEVTDAPEYIESWEAPQGERRLAAADEDEEEEDYVLSGDDLLGIGKEASPAADEDSGPHEEVEASPASPEEAGPEGLPTKPVEREKVGTEFDLADDEEEHEEEIIDDLEPYSEPTPDTRYQVRYPDGMILGPIKLATIKELYETGNLTGEEEVQREEGPWKGFAEMPELMEFMSEEEEEGEDVVELTDVLEDS